jgi:hypothetical protein
MAVMNNQAHTQLGTQADWGTGCFLITCQGNADMRSLLYRGVMMTLSYFNISK